MRRALSLIFFFIPVFVFAQSHAFQGRITDTENRPVPFVTVIVQDADSVVVEAVLSDNDGYYHLVNLPEENYIVLVQHLSYQTAVLSGGQMLASPGIFISEKENTIDDVVVKGERPLVTIVGNTLSYDAGMLIKDRIADNALDVVRELPGITGSGDDLQLVGASKFTIVINGQITSMSLSDLYALLRTIPASQVSRLNVAYNAPAKYNFNGAVIEVELMENTGYEGVTGELAATYYNNFYSGGRLRGSLNVEKERFSINVLGELGRGKSFSQNDTWSRHFYQGDYTDIDQSTRFVSKPNVYSLRLGSDYRLKEGGNLNFAYYYSGSNGSSKSLAGTVFDGPGISQEILSDNSKNTHSHLHNLHLQYDGALTVGADYTRYNSPDKGRYTDWDNSVTQTDYTYKSLQKVDKLNLFANHSSKINTWGLDYGFNFSTARSDNNSDYLYSLPVAKPLNTTSVQWEYFANMFFEVNKQVNERLNFKLGVKGEYQYSNIENNGLKQNIWSEWAFYPDASLSYMPSQKHILQFNMTSDKTYPPYWALSSDRSQLDAYSYVIGNPRLKPSSEYQGQFTYIFNRKYILVGFASYMPDTFRQLPYQLENELQLEYEVINFDYQFQYGFALIIPFKIGKVLDSRVQVNGVEMVDRIKNFHGMNVRNNAFLVLASIRNTIPLYHGTKSQLDLQADFRYQGQAVQGVFDLGEGYSLDAGLRWAINEKLNASVRWNNILRRETPRPIKVDRDNQYSRMVQREFSSVTVNLTWRFGKYEEKKFKSVDSSRFGKN